MLDLDMRLQLVLSPESDVALLLALLVRTYVVSVREVSLQAPVVSVVHVFVEVAAEVTRQVLPVQVVYELQLVEEVLLAEITPRVRQNLRLPVRPRVSLIYMGAQLVQVVQALLSDED